MHNFRHHVIGQLQIKLYLYKISDKTENFISDIKGLVDYVTSSKFYRLNKLLKRL